MLARVLKRPEYKGAIVDPRVWNEVQAAWRDGGSERELSSRPQTGRCP